MFRPLVYSALFATTLGYRIFEYTGQRCTGAEVRAHRLAGPSACIKLDEGAISSLPVKIDNVHVHRYSVNVYGNDDCTGPVVGAIQNMNGCLNNLHASSNTIGKSVQVVPVSRESDTPTSESFETDYLYNLPAGDDEHMEVPIAHGLFRRVDKANHAENGAYVDEAFGMFLTTDLEHVSSIQSIWANPIEDATSDESLNSSSVHVERLGSLDDIQ
ncbi:hypothetical protein IFM58399_03317 [Aspergillus lentulus]|uniref:Uncharacterized protein n=1 Tax=Aspergillus lentulus TaxID=293939 RepID=A0AAN5YI97_ASPLE|nr:uncharacterized protein IFM58399_03317 [Aspergillus lentulus]KAF4159874.1 hypothetical protein CNMCM6069_000380 [Aspergillus lentulus]KAF4166434.1 hypothetical protein CNMCM6936_006520 [Aspergillus lentulus]KAF4173478.1 hypothetical protein CNMCM8060_000129 [Aspergillus lentulus]KAF4193747.1 hypothetical protein CNMCM8694_008437 [Aspergillus lentulus]KAF4201697.1 hypothetical protein CNMCM8927_001241 [Aspergillus lentulus]